MHQVGKLREPITRLTIHIEELESSPAELQSEVS